MEGVDADAEMERVLSAGLGHVLVGADTGRLQSLRGELLVLVRDKMAAEGELVDIGTLASKIEDPDLLIASRSDNSNQRE